MKKPAFVLIIVAMLFQTALSYDGTDLKSAVREMTSNDLDLENSRSVNNLIIDHHSLKLKLNKGQLAFFKPITLDSQEYYYGAYFKGEGRFLFEPPVVMERDQLKRFVGSDSLNRKFDEVLILFNQEIYQKILDSSTQSAIPFEKSVNKKADKLRDQLIEHPSNLYFVQALKAQINSTQKPFVVLNLEPEKMSRTFYMYNPFYREEVKLYLEHWEPGNSYIELVSSFSQYNVSENYAGLNGFSKDQIKVKNYKTEASISEKGIYSGTAEVSFDVLTTPLSIIQFELDPELKIKSVTDSVGNNIEFIRYGMKISFYEMESWQFCLIFDRKLSYGENIKIKLEYEGPIAEKNMGEFFVQTRSDWYPSYGYRQRATFDMTFHTPRKYEFTAVGQLMDEKKSGDTLITHWIMNSPTVNATFSIGNMEKYRFESEDIVPVEVYYSVDLHNELAQELSRDLVATGSHMEEQVAEDIMNSIRVFEHYFGTYPYDNVKVAEILSFTSTAYPGFVHLGLNTWINTDPWGNDRIHRSHEVAHQWWGVQVGYETYHDQWLSEGFATYSSLMYLQRIEGTDKFFDKLKDYRSDIFSVRKYLIGSGEESGPIGLGYRTSSSQTEDDYGLIIYKKGAYVLHMLRNMLIDLKTMNEDLFLAMMKEFYQKYRGKEATTADFRKIAERYAGVDLGWFFDQWIYRNELPTYQFSYETISEGTDYTVKGHIITKDVSPDFKMFMPLEIEFEKNQKAYIRIFIDKTNFEFNLPGLSQKPKKIKLNPFESVLAKIKQ